MGPNLIELVSLQGERNLDIETQEGNHMKIEADIGLMCLNLKNAKICGQPLRDRKDSSSEPS